MSSVSRMDVISILQSKSLFTCHIGTYVSKIKPFRPEYIYQSLQQNSQNVISFQLYPSEADVKGVVNFILANMYKTNRSLQKLFPCQFFTRLNLNLLTLHMQK